MSRLASAVAAYRKLVRTGFPRRYPIVQFPNPPLLVSLAASVLGWFVDGTAGAYVAAVGVIGLTVWAWLEAVAGVNLFRHLLGQVVLVNLMFRLADALG